MFIARNYTIKFEAIMSAREYNFVVATPVMADVRGLTQSSLIWMI